MTEEVEDVLPILKEKENSESIFDKLLSDRTSESPDKLRKTNLNVIDHDNSDDNDTVSLKGIRRRVKRFSDSDSEVEADKENIQTKDSDSELNDVLQYNPNTSSDSDDDMLPKKSRIQPQSALSSDNDSIKSPVKHDESRIKNKRHKLHQKFQNLLKSRSKPGSELQDTQIEDSLRSSDHEGASDTDDSSSGIESIKQKIKQKTMLLKSGICDPDTSSDEEEKEQKKMQKKKKTAQKSAIMISPKPARMSAKQAMENMQKIKSESNRMLREKEVSLPYHRPKALSLKDIMSRRKPAMSNDGKALPIKMNSDQLKQYAKLLEERNKEMMELCKSDSEEENAEDELETKSDNVSDDTTDKADKPIETKDANVNIPVEEAADPNEDEDLPELNIEMISKEPASKDENSSKETDISMEDISEPNKETQKEEKSNVCTEPESQLIQLHYDSEKAQTDTEKVESEANIQKDVSGTIEHQENIDDEEPLLKNDLDNSEAAVVENGDTEKADNPKEDSFEDDFSDTDINMEDLEAIIDNAKDATESAANSPMLIRDPQTLSMKPKLTGAPGMVIDLGGSNPAGPRKLTGVELLKERFTYFAKMKTPEEKEREREMRIKPGMQHLKLKQELEEQISEQRSLEWAKRLEDEKQQQLEMNTIRGDDSDQDDIEKIEAKLEEKEMAADDESSESEEELVEDDCDMTDKPRKKNAMVDDEAEVSDDETEKANCGENEEGENVNEDGGDGIDEEDEESEESSDESSEEEQEENQSKAKKGRILKAFEDSDDEIEKDKVEAEKDIIISQEPICNANNSFTVEDSQNVKDSQDDVLQLAQANKHMSEDLFTSQESAGQVKTGVNIASDDNDDLGTQTFSIINTGASKTNYEGVDLNIPDKLDVICETQPFDEANLDDVVGMCSGKFTQTQDTVPAESQVSETQVEIGDDILALCTGKFYDNQFVSQVDKGDRNNEPESNTGVQGKDKNVTKITGEENNLINSLLQEIDDPKEENKTKIIFDNAVDSEPGLFNASNQIRKKFTIDSDEDENEVKEVNLGKKKKFKKRKPEKRALQISDDEEEESAEELVEEMSDIEEDTERIIEYDSEENEVEVLPQKQKLKSKRKMADFFEQEAELTSEDEWVGSGDEDEVGLDRMEREAGDDDTFQQDQLQRELGQIHMRDVLDQDKREVRLIQELLFEDGDLGDGHRQRKFRWKNADGDEEEGTVPELFGDSQEDEFESEEMWRKQRHEREVFLRQMQQQNETEDSANISIDRSTIIKANLCSKTMSSLLLEVNSSKTEESPVALEKVEKKIAKEAPNQTANFPVFQQNYHGSLLTRGRGALARLAALAMPLAGDGEEKVASLGSGRRNFVFTAVTPDEEEPKVTKRKAESNAGTPRLIKKLKTDDNKKIYKSSLLDHLKT